MTDYSNISVNSINCDKCSIYTDNNCNDDEYCVWIPQNTEEGGKCVNKCGARVTKGECEQYHVWNRSKLTPTVYDFSGSDNLCEWYPNPHSIDDTVNSKEGQCRSKYFDNDNSISSCFEGCDGSNTCSSGECIDFKEGTFCVPNDISILGDVHCGKEYSGHHKQCYLDNNCDSTDCELYVDERKYDGLTGICVSDGSESYDLETGENLGLIMTDEQCGEIEDSNGCMNYRGYGCLWEPFNEYCIPKINDTSLDTIFDSCKPIEAHVPGNYDINMIEEENLNVSEFRERDNNKYPYITSKYLCDVCHIRDNDLDNMKEMSSGSEEDRNNLKYYMIKNFVDFGDGNNNRSSTVSMTPQEYCEREIDDTHELFNPCAWTTDGTNSNSPKGGKCVSKCSLNTPVDSSTTNSQELKYHKEQCISDKWFPDNSVRGVEFPNLIRGSESDDDYFKDRYCTWDGFECHNSIPCKFAQQTRCEDLGYEWYQGSALDIMNQPDNESLDMGIPLDLSTSYPIVRKGDGKPVEGDMEGVCIYPNTEVGYISAPNNGYIINPEFIGNQVIILKWREYGSGWWEDMSCKRKINGLNSDMINDELNNKSYFLGENVALIPFRINQGDRCDDIKNAINNALQNYQYFVYNGEWVIHAEDIIHAIDRSYDSSINEENLSSDESIAKYQKYYGYMYYSNIQSFDQLSSTNDFRCTEQERRHLNAIYDLRGAINILPVFDQHCVLQISNFNIDSNSGNMSLVVNTKEGIFDVNKFEFVEFIGTEIFKTEDLDILNNKLNLTVLSKYNYSEDPDPEDPNPEDPNPEEQPNFLPNNIVQGYGTLYENIRVRNIEKSQLHISNSINKRENEIVNMIDNNYNVISDSFYTDNTQALNTLSNDLNSLISAIRDTVDINDKVINLNNLTNVLDSGLSSIIGQNAELLVAKNELIESMIDLDIDNTPLIHDYDIRNIDEFNNLKDILNLFSSDSNEFDYETSEIDAWAAYNEFKNFNVFSQPIITIKDELNKAEFVPNPSIPSLKKLCSGSLESWKIQTETDISRAPVYQTMNLNNVNGLLKIMAGYLDDDDIDDINAVFEISDITEYKNTYQETDITKSVLWSITRNTPPFWGNLFYNRGGVAQEQNPLYICCGNFNIITDIDNNDQINGKSEFNFNISDNTLIKPFCELNDDELNQKILWKNIMSYTGGNKREIQLSRNVKNDDFQTYIENRIEENSNRNYYDTDGGSGLGDSDYYIGVPYTNLLEEINKLTPLISLSKREYLLRSLNDWKRIEYTYPGSGNIYSGNSVDHISELNNINTSDSLIPFNANLNDFKNSINNTVYSNYNDLLLGEPSDTLDSEGNRGNRRPCWYNGETNFTAREGADLYETSVEFMEDDGDYTIEGRGNVILAGTTEATSKPSSSRVWKNSNVNCTETMGAFRGGVFNQYWAVYPLENTHYINCCETEPYNDLILNPTNTPNTNPFRYPKSDNYSFNWTADIDPTINNHNIESLYRLTNLEKSNEVNNNSDTTDGILKAWGKITSGNSHTENIDTMWSEFNTIETDNNIINNLIYPNDNGTVTLSNINNDKLKKWCTSNSDSLDNSTFDRIPNPGFNKTNNINPNNPENQMGILYSNWLNNNNDFNVNVNTNGYKVDLEDEFFSNNKNYNLYNYPGICEPWLLKVRDTGTENTDNAYYNNTMLDWNNYYGFVPFNNLELPDFSIINNLSGNGDKWDYTNNNLTDTSNVFGLGSGTNITFDQFLQRNIQTNKNELLSEDYNDDNNNLYNMLHPLSITAARPREKIIYIDITPNNDIFNSDIDDYINPYYFENSFEDILTTDYNPNLGITELGTSALNNYQELLNGLLNSDENLRGKYFLLYPGVSGNNNDLNEWNSDENPKIGSSNYIIGKNNNTVISLNDNKTTVESRANFHVSYFRLIYMLLNQQHLIRENTDNKLKYIFDKDFIQKGLNNIIVNMKPNNLIEDNTINNSIFYNNISNNELDFTNYYLSYLPPKGINTVSITNELFGTGFSTQLRTGELGELESGVLPDLQENIRYNIQIPDLPAVRYFNIDMVFPTSSTTEEIEAINICKDLIKSKLSTCGNPNNWPGGSCSDCFETNNNTNIGICSRYPLFIDGIDAAATPDDEDYAQKVGVCGILENNLDNKQPWNFIDITQEPETFGSHLPTVSPYDIENRNCNNLINNVDVPGIGLDFIALEHSGIDDVNTKLLDNVNFFKPARSSSSDIFEDSNSTLEATAFGCMRKDLSLMKGGNLKLSCNTTLSIPVERDKHVLINFIIQHDPTNTLNSSERTKLAIMSEEELINKALDLGIDINEINEYTRPKLQTKVRDTFIPNVCEDGITLCPNGTDEECRVNGGNYRCGLYEEWNDLQKYYYNIHNPDDKMDFTDRKEWYYIGCGIDLNFSDSSSGESVCKDKYPGLCQQNIDKCQSDNPAVKEAIQLDCPETCQVQYSSLDEFKQNQSGSLSICTSRGRCKWSHDMDPSNLLPLCEENTSRKLGSTEKCRNYNSPTNGPEAGSCNLKLYPETMESTICAEQRCTSMQGCVFTPQVSRVCTVSGSVDERITSEEDCPEGGRWIGYSTGGQCILPERNYYESDLQDFEQDCNMLGGSISAGSLQSCEYKPDIPYTGEDPCSHIIDLDDLTYDEQLIYFYRTIGKIYVDDIVPEKLNDNNDDHPKYLKIILNARLNNDTINNYNQIIDLSIYPNNKYIYIDNDTEGSSLCSQYLLGKSKIVKINNVGPGGNENTEIIIGGPDKAYILPLDIETGKIDIGGENACEFRGLYDLEGYTHSDENNTDLPSSIVKANICYNNTNGACNYEFNSKNCVSCGLYKDQVSCFGNNDIDEYSQCGWGSIKDMCEVIGEMDQCIKMHMDGCEWDPASQKCSLNKLTDDDGNPLVDKVGCVKCGDILYKDTCNSMKNCFWDGLTVTDGETGQCRACSSIRPDNNDGIGINVTESDDPFIKNDNKETKCDNFQLTQGQCEFRDPVNKDTGFESIELLSGSILDGEYKLFSTEFWTNIFDPSNNLSERNETSICETEPELCKCSPTRLYPLFPDWIFHNLGFLLIFLPFILYFIYAWYNVLVSPCNLVIKESKTLGGGIDIKEKLLEQVSNIRNYKVGNKLRDYFDGSILKLSNGDSLGTSWIGLNFKDIITGIFRPKAAFDPLAQFDAMIPSTDIKNINLSDISKDKKNYIFYILYLLKFLFLIISLPFTITQYLSRNVRLALGYRLGAFIYVLSDWVMKIPYAGLILGPLLTLLSFVVIIGGSIFMFIAGLKTLRELLKFGIKPNPNYVDPVDGKTHSSDENTYPAAAMFPQTLYREEWDDMIKDPVSDEVIEQRESLLPDALQGDVNNEDNVSDVYRMAYLDIEPDSLNWTQWFRDAGKTYNKFINRIGDKIFYYLISAYLLFRYIVTIKNYLPTNDTEINFKSLKSITVYTIIFSFIFGLLYVLMSKEDPVEGEYDGVETKCYDDIEAPINLGNYNINYPTLCFGDSVNDDKYECPYGCYYIGSGSEDEDYGKKCKDNRSSLSLGKLFTITSLEPDPTLNIPFDESGVIPDSWTMVTPEENKSYVCPPTSRFKSVYPYDAFCSTTAKRCKSNVDTDYHNDICEMIYMKNNYNDEKCSQFIDDADIYSEEEMSNAARGAWDMSDWKTVDGFHCELETPYQNYTEDNWCPFPLPSAENDFFSEKVNTRESVSLWKYLYEDRDANKTCSYNCTESQCSEEEFGYIKDCNEVFESGEKTKDNCENTRVGDSNCTYYPEKVPLQTSLQNQERYLIVNQEYGSNLFN